MGSYSTSEPTRSRPAFESTRGREVPEPTALEAVVVAEPTYDRSLKALPRLGGGLTPDRIVYNVPPEVRDGSVKEVIDYLVQPSITVRAEDRAIVEAIQSRMAASDYRVIINGTVNLANSQLDRRIGQYLTTGEFQGEGAAVKYLTVDIAVVSHEEGGRGKRLL